MTPAEARKLLGLPGEPVGSEVVRAAYLQRVKEVRLEADPDGYASVRGAYELLNHGAQVSAEETAAAHWELAAQSDSADARWRMLSCLPYRGASQAVAILREGAERDPDQFLDELLCHFPDKAPADIIERARPSAGVGRLLLIADAHALQDRPDAALEAFQSAIAKPEAQPAPRLALRPVLSLLVRGKTDAAATAFAMLKAQPTDAGVDAGKAWSMRITEEILRAGGALPLDLRLVAVNAAKRGDFETTPNEARFATEQMEPRDVRKLSATLRTSAPTLAQVFALDVPLKETGPRDFRIKFGVGGIVIAIVWAALRWHFHMQKYREVDEVFQSLVNGYERACTIPESDQCRDYVRRRFGVRSDGGAEAGLSESR